jgi:DNA-binding LacI/PurR family transcriptional regulator
VPVSSVSYVLNNGPRPVSGQTRERVLTAIAELGYRPNEYARRLIQQNWGCDAPPRQFGVLMTGPRMLIARPYHSALMASMYDEAVRQKYALRFIHIYDELHDPILFNELIHQEAIAGIVLLHVVALDQQDRGLLAKVVERVGNVVCLGCHWPGLPSITFDKLAAARTVVDHLVALGHRRIGYVGGRDERFDGYLQGLRQHDLPCEPPLASTQATDNTPDGGWRGAAELLALPSPPTALFAASDEVAIGVLRTARERDFRVPDHLSVVGLDDIELASYTCPPLTTVRVPKDEMAALAVRTLVERVGRPDGPPINMVLPFALIERESSAPPAEANRPASNALG